MMKCLQYLKFGDFLMARIWREICLTGRFSSARSRASVREAQSL